MKAEQHLKADEIAQEIKAIRGYISMASIHEDMAKNGQRVLIGLAADYLPDNFFSDYIAKMQSSLLKLEKEYEQL